VAGVLGVRERRRPPKLEELRLAKGNMGGDFHGFTSSWIVRIARWWWAFKTSRPGKMGGARGKVIRVDAFHFREEQCGSYKRRRGRLPLPAPQTPLKGRAAGRGGVMMRAGGQRGSDDVDTANQVIGIGGIAVNERIDDYG